MKISVDSQQISIKVPNSIIFLYNLGSTKGFYALDLAYLDKNPIFT
jgi:hypothetical protein